MTIGERLKKIREKLGMSQVDFADKINVSKQTLYKYENNLITNIPSDKIEAAAKVGGVSPSYLMGWSEEKEVLTSAKATFYNVSVNNENEAKLILNYRDLSTPNKKKVFDYADGLVKIQKADAELNAAHARTDIEPTEEMDQHDDDIMNDDSEWE